MSHEPSAGRTIRLISATASLAAGTAAGSIITGVAFLFLARATNRDGLGEFGAAYAFSTFCAAFVDFGSSQVMTRELAAKHDVAAFWRWWIRRTSWTTAAIPAVAISIGVVWNQTLPFSAAIALGVQTFAMVAAMGLLAGVRALRSPLAAAWLIAAGNLVFLVGCATPVGSRLGVAALAAAASWATTLVGAALLLPRWRRSPPAEGVNPWRGSAGFGLYALAANAPMLFVPIISLAASRGAAGELAAVNRWVQPIMLVPLSYSAFMFPRFARATDMREVAAWLRSGLPLLWVSLAGVATMVAEAPAIVRLLVGAQYHGAAPVLRLLAIATIPALVSQPVAGALQATHHDRTVATVGLWTSGAGLLIVVGFAPFVGAQAGPIGLAVSGTLLVVFLWKKFVGAMRPPDAFELTRS